MTDPMPLTDELLRQLVAGELDSVQTEEILTRLADDEASLEKVDAMWQAQAKRTAVCPIPPLEPERAKRLRQRLVRQIHQSEPSTSHNPAGTKGWGSVAASWLRPLLNTPKRAQRHRRKGRSQN
jgi:hypothetical protein